jgi:hypothetical protein
MKQEQEPRASLALMVAHRIRALLLDYDFEIAEAIVGMAAFGWGFIVALPLSTFGSSPTYATMLELAPEPIWGFCMAMLGLAHLYVLILNHLTWRKRLAFFSCCVWIFIAALFIMANPASTATFIYPLLAATAAWAYWRLAILYGV